MSPLQRLAILGVAATYLLIVVGAIVRVTGSGMGCGPDWPLCQGRLLPPLELAALIEFAHRLLVPAVSLLLLSVVAAAWINRRSERSIVLAASAVPLLLVTQIGLGAVVVWLELAPMVVLVHLTFALLILGVLVWLAVASGPPPRVITHVRTRSRFHRLAWVTSAAVLGLILTGAYVRANSAGWACAGFPTCNGEALPFGQGFLIDIHLIHRMAAYGVAALVGFTMLQAWRTQSHVPAVIAAASALGIALVAQIAIGASAVSSGLPAALRGLHVAGASAVWLCAIALASLSQRSLRSTPPDAEQTEPASPARRDRSLADTAQAYLVLTKPRVVSLLLVTTFCTMLIAAEGWPALPIVFFTLLGGALSAGAANTINCYLDRDIDRLMERTSRRPLPAGLLAPAQALRFGLILAVLSFVVLTVFVNLLAAVLSLLALLFYVFVYTRWLKRTSPSNIVIGGAAGAMPPLVGWAAVTGELSLLAVFLFAIIFYWTPPHFWALALLIRREYERAGVPMLPVVRGEQETRHQIFLYSLLLVAVTLVVVPLQMLGVFYLFAALVLGGIFLYYALRLLREATLAAARRMFRYSMAYLALLFSAIILDQRVFLFLR